MNNPSIQTSPNNIRFCQQEVLCNNRPYSDEQLENTLDLIYTDTDTGEGSFTGYLKFDCTASNDCCLLFLFFFKGTPYAAGRYADGKPVIYSVQDLARQLVKSDHSSVFITLCETDPVLLKCMLLFLQKEPAVKVPTSLIDFEYIVQQIGEVGEHAMIALRQDNMFNFFFFKSGRCAQVYYADPSFERPQGMTLDEEMQLCAYQSGDPVLAYIYHDMNTSMSEDSNQYDKEQLYTLLTIGYLKNKRKSDQDELATAATADNMRVKTQDQAPKSTLVLAIESGPNQGAIFTVMLPCTIGRKECDLILEDRLVSRRHAILKLEDNTVVIEDLESKNGTKTNGIKILRSHVTPEDIISIGPFNLRIQPLGSESDQLKNAP